jgi:DMSO/TMAO reductase YedYZ molybdopterin-dependent catalytic subunit
MFDTSSQAHGRVRTCIPLLIAVVVAQFLPAAQETKAQSSGAAAELRINGAVSNPLILTVADLKKMPRKTLSVMNPHDKKKETYERRAS